MKRRSDPDFLKNHSKIEDHFDEEWKEILQKAISEGMNKEDFKKIRDFIEFNKWIKDRQSSGNDNS